LTVSGKNGNRWRAARQFRRRAVAPTAPHPGCMLERVAQRLPISS
jgi:hypothetical protein